MSEVDAGRRDPSQLSKLNDVFDFPEEVRLRPGIWAPSLDHLDSMLMGYRVALEVHGVEEIRLLAARPIH